MDKTRKKIPLSESHPEIAAQWHPTKNGELTPDQVTAGSKKLLPVRLMKYLVKRLSGIRDHFVTKAHI